MNDQDKIWNKEAQDIIKSMNACDFTVKHIACDDENWQDGYTNGYIIGRRKGAETPKLLKAYEHIISVLKCQKRKIPFALIYGDGTIYRGMEKADVELLYNIICESFKYQ